MATYMVTGKTLGGTSLISVRIDAIDQDDQIVSELDVIEGIRAYLMTLPGVGQTAAQKQELVTTIL
jgi:hypothetical protein